MSGKVTLRREREEVVADRGPEGLRDGGHVHLSCSNCHALLMDVFRTRPHEPEVWKLQAVCPWCGDKSFVTEVRGGFHIKGAGRPRPGDEDDDIPSTVVDPPEIKHDHFLFPVKKASPDAKPIYRR